MEVRYMNTSDGYRLACRIWEPRSRRHPVGLLHILHGMAEHSARYEEFASYMTAQGFIVCAHDHRGHGLSIDRPENKGWFAEKDGWFRVAEDAWEVSYAVSSDYPRVPVFLFGHSMGSFIARTAMVKHPAFYSGVIICGTASGQGIAGRIGLALARAEARKYGSHHVSRRMDKLSFGSYNKSFAPARTAFDWLSRDTRIVDDYIADDNCGFVCTSGFYVDLITGIAYVNNSHVAAQVPRDLPLLIISGDKDPVGKFGKGVRVVYEMYRDANVSDVTLKLFPDARHELLNETDRDEVYRCIVSWLKRRVEV